MKLQLVVDIQEGFNEDTVVVRVKGNEVFRKDHVTTSLLAGPTASLIEYVEEGFIEVEVIVPTRDLRETTKFVMKTNTYLGVSLIESDVSCGKIRFIISNEPFGYL